MCDIWKSNHERKEISSETLQEHLKSFQNLRVKEVALSGGEALLHSNLWKLCEQLRSIGVRITLLSTGISLKAHAAEVVRSCHEVIVSLDGDRETHNTIRNIPGAFEKLEEGVRQLKKLQPNFRVSGRSVIQRLNFRAFHQTIEAAHALGLDQISFLPADVSSTAFNRAAGWGEERKMEVAIGISEVDELERIFEDSFVTYGQYYKNRFIAESPDRIGAIATYYRALYGQSGFPEKKCNAPWVSAVVESNGDVLPCFFHPRYGNINDGALMSIVNSPVAIAFRKQLNVATDNTCQKCVCSLYRNPWRLR